MTDLPPLLRDPWAVPLLGSLLLFGGYLLWLVVRCGRKK
jgi:hypothetical protein